jgi:hypothetical protein
MWDNILDALELHDTALLNGYDEHGFPFSIRCMPVADRRNRRLWIEIPNGSGIQPGRASILMHSHNEELWDLVQFLIRGTLVKTSEGHYFVPASVNGSPRPAGGMDAIRTLRGIRRRGNAYLEHRNIPRPQVPWDDVKQLQERAQEWREARDRERSG